MHESSNDDRDSGGVCVHRRQPYAYFVRYGGVLFVHLREGRAVRHGRVRKNDEGDLLQGPSLSLVDRT